MKLFMGDGKAMKNETLFKYCRLMLWRLPLSSLFGATRISHCITWTSRNGAPLRISIKYRIDSNIQGDPKVTPYSKIKMVCF